MISTRVRFHNIGNFFKTIYNNLITQNVNPESTNPNFLVSWFRKVVKIAFFQKITCHTIFFSILILKQKIILKRSKRFRKVQWWRSKRERDIKRTNERSKNPFDTTPQNLEKCFMVCENSSWVIMFSRF